MNLSELCKVPEGHDKKSFVGIRVSPSGVPEICFPYGYRLPSEKDARSCIICLLYVLQRAVEWEKQQGWLEDEEKTGIGEFPLWAHLVILRHYMQKPQCLSRKQKLQGCLASGRVDWGRTFRTKSVMFHAHGVSPAKLIRTRTARLYGGFISQIHRYCIAQSVEKLGWLYNVSQGDVCSLPASLPQCIAALKQERLATYGDEDAELLSAMLGILESPFSLSEGHLNTYGTEHFWTVWEMLIDSVFGNVNAEDYFRGSEWYFPDEKTSWALHPLRPDSIMLEGKNAFVLDAKYYNPHAKKKKKNLPATADVNKQLTYAEFVREHHRDAFIYNAFILPQLLDKDAYRFIGWNCPEWRIGQIHHLQQTSADAYHIILACYMDTRWLMDTFMQHGRAARGLRRHFAALLKKGYRQALKRIHP